MVLVTSKRINMAPWGVFSISHMVLNIYAWDNQSMVQSLSLNTKYTTLMFCNQLYIWAVKYMPLSIVFLGESKYRTGMNKTFEYSYLVVDIYGTFETVKLHCVMCNEEFLHSNNFLAILNSQANTKFICPLLPSCLSHLIMTGLP